MDPGLGSWHSDIGGDVKLGESTFAYIDGMCQGWLPPGRLIAQVARGFEYMPLCQEVVLGPAQRDLTLSIKRFTNMADNGWYSGDSHVHFLSTQGAHLEQQAEDLRVVNLLQSQWGSLFTNTEDFTGRVSGVDADRYVTFVGQENRQHLSGHLVLWDITEPVMPWCSDGLDEGEIGGSLEATLSDWADRTHQQGGTVVIPHFPYPHAEAAVLCATGRADAVESINWRREEEEVYYAYLNAGHKLPLVGGTDKMSSSTPVGLYRTYAHVEEPFSYKGWCRAVRAGKTFLSGGPLLEFSVDGHGIGDSVRVRGGGTVAAVARAKSIFPLTNLEVVLGGTVVATRKSSGAHELEVVTDVRVDEDTWLAARCRGQGRHWDERRRPIVAHTSPVYLYTGEVWAARDVEAARFLLTVIEGGMGYVARRGASAAHPRITHHHGGDDHLAYLLKPYQEATSMLTRRYPGLR